MIRWPAIACEQASKQKRSAKATWLAAERCGKAAGGNTDALQACRAPAPQAAQRACSRGAGLVPPAWRKTRGRTARHRHGDKVRLSERGASRHTGRRRQACRQEGRQAQASTQAAAAASACLRLPHAPQVMPYVHCAPACVARRSRSPPAASCCRAPADWRLVRRTACLAPGGGSVCSRGEHSSGEEARGE
jgi:hypothetical protein